MVRQNVSSTNIHSIGYEPDSKILEIEFHAGGIYQYFNVPKTIYDALMNASSHASYFHRHIKEQYKYLKVQ